MGRTSSVLITALACALLPAAASGQGLTALSRARAAGQIVHGLGLGTPATRLGAQGVLAPGAATRAQVEGLLADPDIGALLDEWRLVRGTDAEAAFREGIALTRPGARVEFYAALNALDAYGVFKLRGPTGAGGHAANRMVCGTQSCVAQLGEHLGKARVVGAPMNVYLLEDLIGLARVMNLGPHEANALQAGVSRGLWSPTYVGLDQRLLRLTGRGEDYVLVRDGDSWAVHDLDGNLLGRHASVSVGDFRNADYTRALADHDVVHVRGMLHYTVGKEAGALPHVRETDIQRGLIMGVKEVHALPLGAPTEPATAIVDSGRWQFIRGRGFRPTIYPDLTSPPQTAQYDIAGQIRGGEPLETGRVSFKIVSVTRDADGARMIVEMSPLWADHTGQIDVTRTHLLRRDADGRTWRNGEDLRLTFDESGQVVGVRLRAGARLLESPEPG